MRRGAAVMPGGMRESPGGWWSAAAARRAAAGPFGRARRPRRAAGVRVSRASRHHGQAVIGRSAEVAKPARVDAINAVARLDAMVMVMVMVMERQSILRHTMRDKYAIRYKSCD